MNNRLQTVSYTHLDVYKRQVLNDIKRPFTAIMGGSKVSSKIEIIENLLSKVDNLIIAGLSLIHI